MTFDSRKYVIITLFLLIGGLYIAKLFYMQVVDDEWRLRAAQLAEKRRLIKPPRAVVFDRNGKKVVQNKTYYNLMMVEDNIVDLDTSAFANLIGWTREEVRERFYRLKYVDSSWNRQRQEMEPNYRSYKPYAFITEVTVDEMAKIAPKLENFPGFYEEVSSMRHYPYENAANILGYLSVVYREDIDRDPYYSGQDMIGRAGIESYYEDHFRGIKGVKYVVTTARSKDIGAFEGGKYDTTAVQADPIHLGLDIELQAYGEKLLKGKKGCIVAIEPTTGEILALVSSPTYDPNLMVGTKNIRKNYGSLKNDPNLPLFPRPLQSQYMPGSTFKTVQALVGMQEGVITPESGFPCNKSVVGCHNHPNSQNVSQAVQFSCNPYFYAVTRRIVQQNKDRSSFKDSRIGLDRWAKYMHSFGLGKRLDIDITGVASGNIPDPDYYDAKHGYLKWKFSTIRSISIGQGEVQLTPLQLANLAAIIANRGWYITPHFVKSIGNKGPIDTYRVKHQTMVDEKYFPYVVEGMRRCIHEPGGTARLARVPGITMCGKTGTVENFKYGKGNTLIKKPNHSVFIAFAPMENPKIAICTFIENSGGGGGTWAAPTASLMIEMYLNREVKDKAKEKRILDAELSIWL